MAIASERVAAPPLTYEQYMAEEETMHRYDIVDGVRIWMNPTRWHNRILMNIMEAFHAFERKFNLGQVLLSPCDLLLSRRPLRTRQPDVSFMSNELLAQCPPPTDPSPLEIGPELVVEILSSSERRGAREQKLLDYCAIGVRECWVVHPSNFTVDVLGMSSTGYEIAASYSLTETVRSLAFADLLVPVESIFAD